MDWDQNDRADQLLGVEDDASRRIFDMGETDASSAAHRVELLDQVRSNWSSPVPILAVITDHGSELLNTHQDDRPCLDHEFEHYRHETDVQHSLCKVGRPQSDGKIERVFQTYEKQRWRFDSLPEFPDVYNKLRPHVSLDWDNLETPYEAFDGLLPDPTTDLEDPFTTEVSTDD
jgi:transposase InsO family protein